jgi:hypothetical protein
LSFKVICKECNSENVEFNKSIDGVHFECLNPECGLEVNMVYKDTDDNGKIIYEEEIYQESQMKK